LTLLKVKTMFLVTEK